MCFFTLSKLQLTKTTSSSDIFFPPYIDAKVIFRETYQKWENPTHMQSCHKIIIFFISSQKRRFLIHSLFEI